jgi:hypothetical protein
VENDRLERLNPCDVLTKLCKCADPEFPCFREFFCCAIQGLRPAKVHENYAARFFNNLGWVFDPETRKPKIMPKMRGIGS